MSYSIPDQYVGLMPNQIEGIYNGNSFYFRARHGHWSLVRLGLRPGPNYDPSDDYYIASGKHDEAGWWSQEDAIAFLKNILDRLDAGTWKDEDEET